MKSQLVTWSYGQTNGAPVLLLHDRYGPGDGAVDSLAQDLGDSHQLVVVRSARTQSERSLVRGYFWHLGPYERPEVSTIGDALYHLEILLLEVHQAAGHKVTLFGRGEGGGVALLMGLLWPEVVAGVASVDGPLATNLDDFPIDLPDASSLKVLLVEEERTLEASQAALAGRNVAAERVGKISSVSDWVRSLTV
jgi:pimeloyl-ACP methyl ester carboxylesterase